MDQRLAQAIEFAEYRHLLSIKHQALKEKLESNLIFGYSSGLFNINIDLINYIDFLIRSERHNNIVLLDSNKNPIMIENLKDFQETILDRYHSSLHEYYLEYESLKKQRSNKQLLDL